MNDDQFFLANAYLDGELTAEGRALAEADPVVMAEVAELRALQELVRDVPPPSDAVRGDAVAAALSEFAATRPPPAPAPIPFRPRPAYAKYLAVAAGVLGVGLLGVAVANLDTGGGDDDAADMAAEEPAEEPAAEQASEERLTEEAEILAGDDAAEDADDVRTSEAAAADEPVMAPADEPMEEPEPADVAAEEPAAEGGTGPRPVLVPGQVLTTPEELGSYGTGLVEQQRAGTLPATPNHACPIDSVLGRAEYQPDDAAVVPVLVAVDEPAGVVLAFEDEACTFVAEGPLYLR